MIHFNLPYPPTVNTMYPGNGKRRWLSKRGRAFVQAVGRHVRDGRMMGPIRIGGEIPAQALHGRLGLKLTLCPPDKRKRDLSNCVKAVEDALTKADLWLDDSQIDVLMVVRGEPEKGGSCQVIVWDVWSESRP